MAAAVLLAAPWLLPPRGDLSPGRRRGVQLLRTLATLVLLFAWARPTVVRVATETLRPTLVLLLDTSRSMTVEDALDGAGRLDAVRRMLDASADALERIAQRQEVLAYGFDRAVTPLAVEDGRVALPATADGDQTTLGASLAETLDAARGGATADGDASGDTQPTGPLSGLIVVSDGAQRALPPRDLAPLSAAARLRGEGVPLYAVAVGDRAAADRADLAIDDLVTPDAAFAGTPLTATATLTVRGFPNRQAAIRLLWENADGDDEPVDAARVTVQPGVTRYPIRLRHTPTTPGEWRLTIAADALDGETLTDNNRTSTFVTVREGGVRVLYVAGAVRVGGQPYVEQRYVRQALAASADIAVQRELVRYKPLARDLAERFAPGTVDVVFLDNVDADGLNRASWRALQSLVESGAGLAMLGGRQSFGAGGHRLTLGDVLPVVLGRAERQALDAPRREDVHLPGPLRMVPAQRRGVTHPIVQLDEPGSAAEPIWRRLPPLLGANRFAGVKPNAAVIAQTDSPRNPQPLLVIGSAGLGRVLAFAGDSTWQWALAGDEEEAAHRRFWRQAVLWLAKKDDDPSSRVFVRLGARRVAAGARLEVEAGLRADSGESSGAPNSDAEGADIQYSGTVTAPDGATIDLPLTGAGLRASGLFVDTTQPGEYRVSVTATGSGGEIGDAEARFLVPRRDLELERSAAEPDTLTRMAETTADAGGRALAIEELPALLDELADEQAPVRRRVVARTTLWDTWPVLLLFAGVMTAEWLVRRRSGLP